MGKGLDKLFLIIAALFVLFLIYLRLTVNLLTALLCALFTVLIILAIIKLLRPKLPKGKISLRDFVRIILLNGNAYLRDITEYCLSSKTSCEHIGDHTLLCINGTKVLVFYAYKFSSLGEEDVAKSYRVAAKCGAEEIYVLTNHSERKALVVAEYIPQKLRIISSRTLYGFIAKHGALPDKTVLKRERKIANSLKTCLSYGNVKYYLFAALCTSFAAMFIPINLYYIIFASLNVALAAASIAVSNVGTKEKGLFK